MKRLVIIRGAGEIASGAAIYLHNAGFRVLILEKEKPSSTRREVSFADAAYDGEKTVARVTCKKAGSPKEAEKLLKAGELVMLIDPGGRHIAGFEPQVVIDALMANENFGTTRDMAQHTLALGPGFCAGRDVDAVVETMRGHTLGRIIYEGYSYRKEGEVFQVGHNDKENILLSPVEGRVEALHNISCKMEKGEPVARIHQEDGTVTEICAHISGVLRGIVREGSMVSKGQKLIDINPVMHQEDCFTISDKVRCIAGAVLQAVMKWENQQPKRRFF